MSQIPLVALIGRPNSGKSTLLNKITSTKSAIVAKEAHTTRDLNYGQETWDGMYMKFVDTGGLVPNPGDKIQKGVQVRAWSGIEQADLLVWVFDKKKDPDAMPLEIMQRVWKTGKPFLVVVNKVDDPNLDASESDYVHLGGQGFINISANNGYNIGNLLDLIVEKLQELGFQKMQIKPEEATKKTRKKRNKAKKVVKTGEGYILRDEEGLYHEVEESELYEEKSQKQESNTKDKNLNKTNILITDLLGVLVNNKGELINPDFVRFLKSWKSREGKIYYLSNIGQILKSNPDFLDKFESNIGYLFSGGVTNSDQDNTYSKPDPEIYKHLLKKFHLQADKCIFIDDNKDNLAPAEDLGMSTYLFDPKNQNTATEIARLVEFDTSDLDIPSIMFLGKPNVGKSSLFNTMLGKEVQIVTDIAGTTLSVNDEIIERVRENKIQKVFFAKSQINYEDIELINYLKQSSITCLNLTKDTIINSDDSRKQELHVDLNSLFDEEIDIEKISDPKSFLKLIDNKNLNGRLSILITDNKEIELAARQTGIKTLNTTDPRDRKMSLIDIFQNKRARIDLNSTKKYKIIDSVGVRRPGQRKFGAETFATFRTVQLAQKADVLCLVLDGSQTISHQDLVVAGIIKESKKGLVVIANKSDLVDITSRKKWEIRVKDKLQFLKTVDIIWTSSVSGKGVEKVWKSIDRSLKNRNKEIDKEKVRKLFNYIVRQKPPKKLRTKKRAIMYDLIYSYNKPPTFELLVKDKTAIHWSYLRFLENLIRQNFDFSGTEINVKVKDVDRNRVLN